MTNAVVWPTATVNAGADGHLPTPEPTATSLVAGTNGYANAGTDGHTDANSDGHPDTGAYGDTNAGAYGYSDARTNGHANGGTDRFAYPTSLTHFRRR